MSPSPPSPHIHLSPSLLDNLLSNCQGHSHHLFLSVSRTTHSLNRLPSSLASPQGHAPPMWPEVFEADTWAAAPPGHRDQGFPWFQACPLPCPWPPCRLLRSAPAPLTSAGFPTALLPAGGLRTPFPLGLPLPALLLQLTGQLCGSSLEKVPSHARLQAASSAGH